MLHIFVRVHYDIGYQIENVIIYVFIFNLCLNWEFLQKCPLLKFVFDRLDCFLI